jgi:RNA polymerase sigma-70 factor (ECF subfamily)
MRTIRDVELADEHESWLAAVAGNGEAFASIFDRHSARVYRHAQRLTQRTADAEDVTAAAFFELWRRRRSVRVVDGSILPWLLVTTTNLARNTERGLRRYRSMLASLPRSTDSPAADEFVVQDIDDQHVTELVRRVLTDLKPADAALISLTAFEHYSPTEAAEALGISAGTARTRLHRARARVAAALEATEDRTHQVEGGNR